MLLTKFLNKIKMINRETRVSGVEVCIRTLFPVLMLWIVFALQAYSEIDITIFSTHRSNGVWSIITGPILHENISHILGNTVPMLVCLPIIAKYYKQHYHSVLSFGFIIPSVLIYILEMPAIGISGLGYALVFFVISAGMFSEDKTRFIIGVSAMFFYGGLLKGATTLAENGIAWQAHVAGLIVGVLLGILSIKIKK